MLASFAAWALVMAQAIAPHEPSLSERIRMASLAPEERSAITSALSVKDYARIESVLTAGAVANPAHAAELYALLGAIYSVGLRMDLAATAFRRADAVAPLDERDRFTLAMALADLGDTPGARDELNLLNRKHPDQPLYIYWLARLDYYQRRYEDSVVKLQRVLQLDPQSPRAYDNLGLSFDMMGRYEEARAAFEKAVEFNRRLKQPSAWPPHNLGDLLLRLERTEEAEKALRESLQYDSRFAMARYHLGRALEKEGRDAAAVDEYRAAISLDTSLAEPCYSLGMLYRRLKRADEADAAFAEFKRRKSAAANLPQIPNSNAR